MTIIKEDESVLAQALIEAHMSPNLKFTKLERGLDAVRKTGVLLPFNYDDMDEEELADVIETITGGSA